MSFGDIMAILLDQCVSFRLAFYEVYFYAVYTLYSGLTAHVWKNW